MTQLLDKSYFEIDVNKYNPNGFCLTHVEPDESGSPIDLTFVYVNEAFAGFAGKSINELVGHRLFEVFPNGHHEWLDSFYDASYLSQSSSFDYISEQDDCYMHVDVYPVGELGYCIGMLQDIKKNILKNEKHRHDLQSLIDELETERNINIKIREYSTAMGVVYPLAIAMDYKNDSYHMIEYDNFINKTAASSGNIDELIRVGASTLPDADAAKQFWDIFNRQAVIEAFAQGKREISLRHPQNGDDGKVHYMDTHVICTEFSDERIEAISLSRCIDDEAERDRVIRSEAAHTSIINAISTIYNTIMEVDLRTHICRNVKNDTLAYIDGDKSESNFDRLSQSVLDSFIHPDFCEEMHTFINLDTLPARLASSNTVLTTYQNLSGSWFEARFIVQKRDEFGQAITALYVSRNITAEKQREIRYHEQLRAAAIEAEKANVSKTNFLRRMSHDIRTPLNGIIGMLNIAGRYRDDREKYDECMEKISHSADYLLDLVNNVLDISKLESGAIELEHKPFDLGKLLLDTLPVVVANAEENGIKFLGGRESSHVTHRYVIGSPVHLNRVLMNIASNAVKYNRPGGTIKIYCNELASTPDTATYEFICEDTGLGMSEEFQKHAFEPFSQEGKETTTSFSGTGLGLSIVKEIIGLMGGTVELKSRENVGTTIRILLTLPLDTGNASAAAETEDEEDVDVSGRTALLVEDNELNMEIAKIMLEEMGLVITEANNGRQAVDIFSASQVHAFDYIFMDMMMPVMDGIDATRAIRALPREDAASVPIIAMTANAFAEDRQACIDAGMNDHIGKPIDAKTLRRIVKHYVR